MERSHGPLTGESRKAGHFLRITVCLRLGECAQVDWGAYGTVAVGNTRRRLSFFVMVLAFSRQMFVEFTRLPRPWSISSPVTNMPSRPSAACRPRSWSTISNRRYCSAWPVPHRCSTRVTWTLPATTALPSSPAMSPAAARRGRVESAVGYVKKNFLHGLELSDFSAIGAARRSGSTPSANLRIHGQTQRRPVDLLAQEKTAIWDPLNPHPYDLGHTSSAIASSQFRITVDTNQYSVPAAYAHRRLTVKAYPDRVCLYFDNQLIAHHPRRYGRHEDIEDPDHAKALIAQRGRAREQRLMMHFLALSPDAQAYYEGLEQRRFNARHHVRKILALAAEIYAADAVARAISDGLAFQAFSAEKPSPTSWRPGPVRCRSRTITTHPVATTCSTSFIAPRISTLTR